MGNADTKLNFRKAVVQLTSKSQVSGGSKASTFLKKLFDINSGSYFSLLTLQMIVFGISFGQRA